MLQIYPLCSIPHARVVQLVGGGVERFKKQQQHYGQNYQILSKNYHALFSHYINEYVSTSNFLVKRGSNLLVTTCLGKSFIDLNQIFTDFKL